MPPRAAMCPVAAGKKFVETEWEGETMAKARGADGVMIKRNLALARLARLAEADLPTEEGCELVRQVICGDEGPTVYDVFPPAQAEKIVQACRLVCALEPER